MVNKGFIADLMPKHPIYTHLLSAEAQKVLGKVHAQTEPALERLAHRLTDFLRQRGLGGIVFERKDRDGSDVGQRAAVEAIRARAERQARRANGDCAKCSAE